VVEGKIKEEEIQDDFTLDSARDRVLGKGTYFLYYDIKDFFVFMANEQRRIRKHAFAELIKSQAEFFFAGLQGWLARQYQRRKVYNLLDIYSLVVLIERLKLKRI